MKASVAISMSTRTLPSNIEPSPSLRVLFPPLLIPFHSVESSILFHLVGSIIHKAQARHYQSQSFL